MQSEKRHQEVELSFQPLDPVLLEASCYFWMLPLL